MRKKSEASATILNLEKLADNTLIEDIPTLQAILSAISIKLSSRAMRENHKQNETAQEDELLNVRQAAKILGCSVDRFYRHPAELKSIEVHDIAGERGLRYSKKAIQGLIANSLRK